MNYELATAIPLVKWWRDDQVARLTHYSSQQGKVLLWGTMIILRSFCRWRRRSRFSGGRWSRWDGSERLSDEPYLPRMFVIHYAGMTIGSFAP